MATRARDGGHGRPPCPAWPFDRCAASPLRRRTGQATSGKDAELSAAVDLLALAQLAGDLARAAGDHLLGYKEQQGSESDLAASAETKSSRTDLVTAADRASEQLIVDRLRELRPDDAILAEERGGLPGASGLTWVIDPLDGTTNFLYDFPAFAVSIACEDAEGSIVGVVHDPLRAETFRAARGLGAWLGNRRLVIGPGPQTSEALIGTGFAYGAERRALQASLLLRVLPSVRDIRRAGAAALDLCWVAAGRLDAFYEGGLQPWDHAAGALVVREAGGTVDFVDGLLPAVATIVAGPASLCSDLRRLLSAAAGGDGA